MRSLRLKQSQIFDFVFNWAKLQVKVKYAIISNQSKPFHLFLSGSEGCGKLHLIKTIYHAINKVFLYRSGDPGKSRILSLIIIIVTFILYKEIGFFEAIFTMLNCK